MIRREAICLGILVVMCSLFLTPFVLAQDINASVTLGCTPVWACHDWEACDANGTQHRECSDLNNCNSMQDIPPLVQQCGASATGDSSPSSFSVVDIVLIICGVLFVLILLFILIARRMRRKKSGGAAEGAPAVSTSTSSPPSAPSAPTQPIQETIIEKAPSTPAQPMVNVRPEPENNELRSVLR